MNKTPYKLIDEFKEIIAGDPVFSVRSAISPLFMLVTWQEKVHPLDVLCITKRRDSTFAYNDKKYIAVAEDKFRDYFQGKVSIQGLQDEYDVLDNSISTLYEKVTDTDLIKLSDKELCDLMNEVNKLMLDVARITLYVENVDLEKILSVTGPEYKDSIESIWDRATEAVFISFENRRLKKQLDLISYNPDNLVRQAKFMYTDYFWTKTSQEISHALDTIQHTAKEKSDKYEHVHKQIEDKRNKHNQWLATLDLKLRKIAEFIQLVMHMRDTRKDQLAQLQAILAEISVVMLERIGVDPSLAPYVVLYEYIKGISYLSSIKDDIVNRPNGCIYLAKPDITCKTEPCNFESALEQFDELIKHREEKFDILRGQVACRGKVEGTVRVILDPHDDKGFQQGDILVTSMTRPEFVQIMKKAGAVVTNEGGVTCHAAIVSRELNIPCVIGTKHATRILKDGDRVEVDAEKGVITILK
jgi:phosphohistidine swiveling domain-containing protein